ncbi:MAG: hypothetical protein LUC44_08700, partial [Prevotellaceae bacterium]|nr:hypothetical protein [Prevotellaceae bacterium]
AQETQEALVVEPSTSTVETDAAPLRVGAEMPMPGVPSSASRPYAAYAQPEAQTSGHTSRYVAKGGHRGFDFGVDLGFLAYTGEGGGGAFAPVVSAGKRFSKNIYAGIDAGAEVPFNGGSTFGLFAGDFRFYAPLQNPRFAPGGMLQVGYEGDFDLHSYVMIQVMPTFQFGISKTVDFNVGVGYTEYVGVGGIYSSGNNFGAVTAKIGFGFHMDSDKQVSKRSKKPDIENGIQLTFEGDFMACGHIDDYGGGASLVATYKYNPHISFGVGFGFDALDGLINKNGMTTVYTSSSQKESIVDIGCSHFFTKKLFLRGNYRILDQRHSPLVSCDFGVFFQTRRESYYIDSEHFRKSGVFITPAVGYSLRTTTNSFLEVKVGYTASSSIIDKYVAENKTSKTTYGKLPISGLYLSVGYTHTFNWGQNWFKKH